MALAGLIIVIGCLYLLYKGIITLQAVSKVVQEGQTDKNKETDQKATIDQHGKKSEEATQENSALNLEITRDKIKVQSQYPTIALFFLGIACFFGAMHYLLEAQKVEAQKVEADNKKLTEEIEQKEADAKLNSASLEGQVVGADRNKYTFTIEGDMGATRPDINGKVKKTIPVDIEEVVVKVGKGGGEVDSFVLHPIEAKNGVLSFGQYPTPTPAESPQATPITQATPLPQATSTPVILKVDPSQIAPAPTHFPTPLFKQ